jgi:hypothetical protein
MGPEDLKKVEIRSAVMGIRVTITEEVIIKAARYSNSGKFQLKVKKNSFGPSHIDKTCDLQDEHMVLHKLIMECFMPRDGGSGYRSLEHNLFMHFIINHQKVNLPKYIILIFRFGFLSVCNIASLAILVAEK